MIWDVRMIRNAGHDPAFPDSHHDTTSYRTLGSSPPDDVLAGMERVAGWPALVHPPDGLSAYVEWKARPDDGAPPHLSISVSLGLDELWRVPMDQVTSVGPSSAAPGLAAAILDDMEATGQPFALSVSAGYLVLDVRSWQR